jgi:hypothetical protein
MKSKRRRRCLVCEELFSPDVRNHGRQKCCAKSQCRQAAKAVRQRRWLEKPENQDYFRGTWNVERVRQWQKAHPGYWKRSSRRKRGVLQDALRTQAIEPSRKSSLLVLQDLCRGQDPVIVGLIAHLSASVFQDDICATTQRLIQLGRDVLAGTALVASANSIETS